jgi:hypothetical protein
MHLDVGARHHRHHGAEGLKHKIQRCIRNDLRWSRCAPQPHTYVGFVDAITGFAGFINVTVQQRKQEIDQMTYTLLGVVWHIRTYSPLALFVAEDLVDEIVLSGNVLSKGSSKRQTTYVW